MDDSSLPGPAKPNMPNLSRRRPSLQIDGILMSDRDESNPAQGHKHRMSLNGGTLLDYTAASGGQRRGTLVAAGAPTLLGSIQSRSTRALYESTESMSYQLIDYQGRRFVV